ncbi:hypothetical protein E8E11_001847 [Didymella keratinophila]|nr:hypothetical protein E8E11_001847 [Didymella keratinophila]
MPTAVQSAVSLPPQSISGGTTRVQGKKGKERLQIGDKNDPDGNESEATVKEEHGRAKAKAPRRIEGLGVEEVMSDASSIGEDNAISESELSSSNESDSETTQDKQDAEKQERRAKRDSVDKRQAAAVANEGFANYTSQRGERASPEKRPEPVEREWRRLYPLIKQQWKKGGTSLSGQRAESFKKANERIKRFCDGIVNVDIEFNTKANAMYLVKLKQLEETLVGESESTKMVRRKQLLTECARSAGKPTREELLKKWQFPAEELSAQIYAIEVALEDLGNMSTEEALKKKIASYDETLADEMVEDSDVKKKKDRVEKRLLKRRSKTEKLLQTALIFLENLEKKGIPPNEVLSSRADEVFQNFVSQSSDNRQLYNAIKAEMERPTLQQLDEWETAIVPMCNFVACVKDDAKATQQQVAKAQSFISDLNDIDRYIVSMGDTGETNCLPMSLLHEILNQWEQGHRQQVQQNVANLLKQLRRQEAAVGLVRAIELGNLGTDVKAAPKPATEASDVRTHGEGSAKPAVTKNTVPQAPREAAAKSSTIGGTNLSEDFLRNLDITTLKLRPNTSEMFQYENGMTEHGPLVATRLSTTGNAAHNRYCVNAGLDEPGWEYHKVFRGSDLGRGGAEKLADQKIVEFDLRQRLKDIKGDHPITKVGPVVIMPHAKGYVPRGTKERRPDAYIFVHYRGIPEPELLTRTQHKQLEGKRGMVKFEEHEKIFLEHQIKFEAAKIQKRHPKTGNPLTAKDRKKTPWLFPENDQSVPDTSGDVNNEVKVIEEVIVEAADEDRM